MKTFIKILVVLVIVLVAVIFMRTRGPSAGDRLLPERLVDGLSAFEVSSATSRVMMVQGAGGWTIESLHGYPAVGDRVSAFIADLRDAVILEVMEEDGDAFTAALTCVLGTKDASWKLALGALSEGEGGGRLVRLDDGPVIRVDRYFDGVTATPAEWADARVLDLEADAITQVSVSGMKAEFTMVREGTSWRFIGDQDASHVNQAAVQGFLGALMRLEFDGIVPPGVTDAEASLAGYERIDITVADELIHELRLAAETLAGGTKTAKVVVRPLSIPPPTPVQARLKADRTFSPPADADDVTGARERHREAVYEEMMAAHARFEGERSAKADAINRSRGAWRYVIPAERVEVARPFADDLRN